MASISRRDFVKGSAIAAGLLSVPGLLAACRSEEGAAPSGNVGTAGGGAGTAAEREQVALRLWSQVNDPDFWRVDGPARAVQDVEGWDIKFEGVKDAAAWPEYKRKFTLAAEAGEAPEIVVSGHEDSAPWSQAGFIVPLDDLMQGHTEFENVFDSLWKAATYNGQVWGVPQDTNARPLFYHKEKLAELGWSQDEINGLQQRIDSGEYTHEDMIETAVQATEQGVVEPGFGFYHRPSKGGDFLQYYVSYGGRLHDDAQNKLVLAQEPLIDWYAFQRRVVDEGITRENFIGTEWEVWLQDTADGKSLFFPAGTWFWAEWLASYVSEEQGGEDYLRDFMGWSLQPSGRRGEPGVTLSTPLLYFVTSESASGTTNQEAAVALLAKTTTAEINTLHAVESAHLGILETQEDYPAYEEATFLSETLYMAGAPGNFALPNHPAYGPYFDAMFNGMVRAENGEATPQQAADEVKRVMEAEIGDSVIFE